MRKFFYFAILSVVLFSACNNNMLIEDELVAESSMILDELKLARESEDQISSIGGIGNEFPTCLQPTLADTFIYYANQFNNYFWTETNQTQLLDSIGLINLVNNSNISSLNEIYLVVSTTFDIPLGVVEGFFIYSSKIAPQLERETVDFHPIASRYYQLIKSGCLISIFPDYMFEEEEMPVLRRKCTFWGMWSATAGLALSLGAAVTTEITTVGIATPIAISCVISAVNYGIELKKCL